VTEAIVLAGGLGTRLRSVVADVPKPMAPIRGRPFLAYVLDCLARQGISRTILSIGHLGELIETHFGRSHGAMALAYSRETEPLGTGGALAKAMPLAASAEVIAVNGDTLLDVAFGPLLERHRRAGAPVTLTLVNVPDVARYGAVALDADGVITAFHEKGGGGPGLINGGVYALRRTLFTEFPMPARFSFERDFLSANVAKLRPRGWPVTGAFVDIGVPEDYARAQSLPLSCPGSE
jgi:NDP-sugar pyrophosphorylase family protein